MILLPMYFQRQKGVLYDMYVRDFLRNYWFDLERVLDIWKHFMFVSLCMPSKILLIT